MAQETETKVTLAGVAAMVEELHERCDTDRVPLPWCDVMRRELGVGAACTGNPATVEQSRQYAPKTGLTFGFYYVLPGYRGQSRELVRVGYVATWRGVEYRGEVVGHKAPRDSAGDSWGLWFYDATRYAATVPDGCRKLIVQTVEAAAVACGLTVGEMETEKAHYNAVSAIYSKTYEALRALRDAVEIDGGAVL